MSPRLVAVLDCAVEFYHEHQRTRGVEHPPEVRAALTKKGGRHTFVFLWVEGQEDTDEPTACVKVYRDRRPCEWIPKPEAGA